jgi:hypothetical protein
VEAEEGEGKCFTLPELKMPEAWVHAEVPLRPNGRCQVKPAPEDEGGEVPDLEAKRAVFFAPFTSKDAASDHDPSKVKPGCRSIAEDLEASSGKALWVLRALGSSGSGGSNLCMARSLKWPGAVSIAAGFNAPQLGYVNEHCVCQGWFCLLIWGAVLVLSYTLLLSLFECLDA